MAVLERPVTRRESRAVTMRERAQLFRTVHSLQIARKGYTKVHPDRAERKRWTPEEDDNRRLSMRAFTDEELAAIEQVKCEEYEDLSENEAEANEEEEQDEDAELELAGSGADREDIATGNEWNNGLKAGTLAAAAAAEPDIRPAFLKRKNRRMLRLRCVPDAKGERRDLSPKPIRARSDSCSKKRKNSSDNEAAAAAALTTGVEEPAIVQNVAKRPEIRKPQKNTLTKAVSKTATTLPPLPPRQQQPAGAKPKRLVTANAVPVVKRRSTKSSERPRARRVKPAPQGGLHQMDWYNLAKGKPTKDAVANPREPHVEFVHTNAASAIPREPLSIEPDVVNLADSQLNFPLNLPREAEASKAEEALMDALDLQLNLTDSDNEGEINARIAKVEKEGPSWVLSRFQLRKVVRLAGNARMGIRPSMAECRLAAFLQRLAKQQAASERVSETWNEPRFRVFLENFKRGTAYETHWTAPGSVTGCASDYERLGAFYVVWAIDGFGFWIIQDLKIWARFNTPDYAGIPRKSWKLISLSDAAIGQPSRVLATLNETPLLAYPWPCAERENWAIEKTTLLLSLGFSPLVFSPEYAREAELLTPQVLEVLAQQTSLDQPPPREQMEAVSTKLENSIWRSIPTLARAELLGTYIDQSSENERVLRRFVVIQGHIDNMFGALDVPPTSTDPAATGTSAANGHQSKGEELLRAKWTLEHSIDAIVQALPRFFRDNKEFWPTRELVQSLLMANSLHVFTESPLIMASFGVHCTIPAEVITFQNAGSNQENRKDTLTTVQKLRSQDQSEIKTFFAKNTNSNLAKTRAYEPSHAFTALLGSPDRKRFPVPPPRSTKNPQTKRLQSVQARKTSIPHLSVTSPRRLVIQL
ncbi:unnamed protein product, partial [Oikopleura dioica]